MVSVYQRIFGLLLSYKYFIFFPLVMFEGPVTTLVAGFLCSLGYMNFLLLIFLAPIADLASDALYYALGRWGRKKVVEKHAHRVGLTPERVEKLEDRFKKHGVKMLAFGKVADPLSSTIQTIAGLTRMNFKKYFWWNAVITFPKSFAVLTIGFYFGEAIGQADFYRRVFGIVVSIAGIVAIVAYLFYRRIVEKKL